MKKMLCKIAEENENISSKEKMFKSLKLIDEFLEEKYKDSPEEIDELIEEIESLYDDFLTKEEAEEAVNKFINMDGTKGEHWSIDVIENTLKQKGIPVQTDKYSLSDIYYMINNVYSDAPVSIRNDTNFIIEQALCKLNDPDFYAGGKSYSKAYVEWMDWLKEEYLKY